jgi:hypothetical protein
MRSLGRELHDITKLIARYQQAQTEHGRKYHAASAPTCAITIKHLRVCQQYTGLVLDRDLRWITCQRPRNR